MKILVFTTDVPPLGGLPTSGTALRTYGMVQGLRAHGHEVVVSAPKTALAGLRQNNDISSLPTEVIKELNDLDEYSFDSFNQADLLAQLKPDAILCGHWPAMSLKVKPKQPLIIDLAGPHLLERHYQGSENQKGAILAKLAVIATSDYFIISGPSQRLYFFSFLLRAGIDHPEKRTCCVPMPLSPDLPERNFQDSESFPRFIFGGVFLPWQNPQHALRTLGDELGKRDKGHLQLVGGKHPNYEIKDGGYEELFAQLSENPRVNTKPMMPLDSFINELTKADVALDVMSWNLERQLAMTIRSTTYLWSGLPVIYNDFADLGGLIKQYDAGWTVKPGDTQALEGIVDEIYKNPELVRQKSVNAQRLARELFSWDKAVEPVLELLGCKQSEKYHHTDIVFDCPESADYPVYGNKKVQQYFVCRAPGLTKVECRIATHNRRELAPVTFRLFKLPNAKSDRGLNPQNEQKDLICEQVHKPIHTQNNDWLTLETAPLQDSCGGAYMLEMESSESPEQESISPWAIKSSPYPMVGLYYGQQKVDYSGLCLRTTCLNTPQS